MDGPFLARSFDTATHDLERSCIRPVCAIVCMTAGPDGLRGSASMHCGALDDAMTVRSVPIQVLTIVPSRWEVYAPATR